MTSVPYLQGGGLRSAEGSAIKSDQFLALQLRSSLPSKLLEIRHIKSILIKRITINSEDLNKLSGDTFGSDETRLMKKGGNDLKNNKQNEMDVKVLNDNNKLINSADDLAHDRREKLLRKGKSSYDLSKDFKSGPSLNNVSNRPNTAKDDNYLTTGTSVRNTTLSQPIEIRRQLEFQKINEDTFFDCFYTINNFLNIDDPYFISRVFPSHVELADELEIHAFAKSATINLFVKSEYSSWKLSRQYHIKLSLLVNLGDDLYRVESKLKHLKNLLLLRFTDDCYYTLPNEAISPELIKSLRSTYLQNIIEKFEDFHYKPSSCSYDQIMTMNNYSRCIHDLLHTKLALDDRISQELIKENSLHKILDNQNTLKTSSEHLNDVVHKKVSHNFQLEKKVALIKKQINELKSRVLQLKYPAEVRTSDTSIGLATETSTIQEENSKLTSQINIEKARIASIIQFIFPMKPISNKHDFSLFQTCFPSSLIPQTKSFEKSDHSTIIPISIVSSTIIQRLAQVSRPHSERLNSLIGYIALIVLTVADIFNIPLRYPIRELGSSSYIHDPISNFNVSPRASLPKVLNDPSAAKSATIYPLFICRNATLAVKFTYALLLLRKDLEQLYEVEGIVKVEEFNLLVAYDFEDIDNTSGGSIAGDSTTATNEYDSSNYSSNAISQVYDAFHDDGKVPSLLTASFSRIEPKRRISGCSRFSKFSNASVVSSSSRDLAVSGISAISVGSNASSIVNEYNQKLHTEERIKHIKKHLLKGSSGKL